MLGIDIANLLFGLEAKGKEEITFFPRQNQEKENETKTSKSKCLIFHFFAHFLQLFLKKPVFSRSRYF